MAKKEKVSAEVRIADIHESRFFIQHSNELTEENVRQSTAYQIRADSTVVDETEQVAVIFDIRLILKKNPDIVLLHLVANMRFEVHGIELTTDSDALASIPTNIMQMLMAATYSTLRGLLYARCAGSILRLVPLPLHDPSVFLQHHKSIKGPVVAKPLPEK